MDSIGKHRLEQILKDIDEEASLVFGPLTSKMVVIIAGGSAFILRDLTKRPVTHDIDVLESDNRLKSILSHYPAVNGKMAAFCDSIPYNFEDRLTKLDLATEAIDFMVPSLEDLAIMKLYAWRPNDIADPTSPQMLEKLDWNALELLVYDPLEAKASCLSDSRYRELVSTYERYKKDWCHEPHI